MDKPSGITSSRAVEGARRLLPRKTKVGHTGTLDPLASGLLVLMVGRATRLSRYLTHLDKAYTATARFGATSDTLDAEGGVQHLDTPMPDEHTLRATLPDFTGELLQTPPMASAVKVGGERLYERHRRGENIERESRPVTVHSLALVSHDPAEQSATFEIHCTGGTYVRTLISDLASSLGTGAYLTALRRTSVEHLTVGEASTLDDLSPENIHKRIMPSQHALGHLPAAEVGEGEERVVCNGGEIEACGVEGSFRVEREGELLAVYRGDGGRARAEVVLCAR